MDVEGKLMHHILHWILSERTHLQHRISTLCKQYELKTYLGQKQEDHLIFLVTGWMFLLNGTESDCNPIKHFTQKFNKMYFFGSAHSKFGGGVFSILVSFFFDFFA